MNSVCSLAATDSTASQGKGKRAKTDNNTPRPPTYTEQHYADIAKRLGELVDLGDCAPDGELDGMPSSARMSEYTPGFLFHI